MSTQNLAQFEFVPVEINGTGQVKNRQVQRKIRKHVMKDIGRARRRDTTAESTELIIHGPARVTATLGSGQSDPFASYPVKMTLRMHELVNHSQSNLVWCSSPFYTLS